MIKVDNVAIPTPSNFSVGVLDISKAERNTNGLMIIERIATKRKLEVTYNYLTQAELSDLLQKISGVFFDVEYPDTQTGALRTGEFYVGDRNAETIDFQDGIPRYKNIKFSLIER